MTLRLSRFAHRALIRALWLGLLLGLLTSFSTLALAQPGQPERGDNQEQAELSAAQAAQLVKQRYGGKIIKVQSQNKPQGKIYRVQLLQDSGRMRNVRVDARSGAILN